MRPGPGRRRSGRHLAAHGHRRDGRPTPSGDLAPLAHGRVRISEPSSVTRIVCSNWAVQRRSLVTTVQPSRHIWYSWVPSVIIGSIVNVIPGSMTVVSDGLS